MRELTDFDYQWEKAEFQEPTEYYRHVLNYLRGEPDSDFENFAEAYSDKAIEIIQKIEIDCNSLNAIASVLNHEHKEPLADVLLKIEDDLFYILRLITCSDRYDLRRDMIINNLKKHPVRRMEGE